jgi:hypothetical protein
MASRSCVTMVHNPIVSADRQSQNNPEKEKSCSIAALTSYLTKCSIDKVRASKLNIVVRGHSLDVITSAIAVQYIKSIFWFLLPIRPGDDQHQPNTHSQLLHDATRTARKETWHLHSLSSATRRPCDGKHRHVETGRTGP